MLTSCRKSFTLGLTDRGLSETLKAPIDSLGYPLTKKASDAFPSLPKAKKNFVCKLFAEFLPAGGVSFWRDGFAYWRFLQVPYSERVRLAFVRVRGKQAEAASFFYPASSYEVPHV